MLFEAARLAVEAVLSEPQTQSDIASALDISATQTKQWLARMIEDGHIEKTKKPVKYRIAIKKLFN